MSDPIFIGLTRPPMLFGVPYSWGIISAITVVIIFVLSGNLAWLALALPLHAAGYVLSLNDPRWLDIWLLKVRRCGLGRSRHPWQSISYGP